MAYRVVYSERVRSELKVLLTKDLGRGLEFLDAVKQLDALLRNQPHCGQPLMNLKRIPLQIHVLAIGPLAARYVLNDERKLVLVVLPFMPV